MLAVLPRVFVSDYFSEGFRSLDVPSWGTGQSVGIFISDVSFRSDGEPLHLFGLLLATMVLVLLRHFSAAASPLDVRMMRLATPFKCRSGRGNPCFHVWGR